MVQHVKRLRRQTNLGAKGWRDAVILLLAVFNLLAPSDLLAIMTRSEMGYIRLPASWDEAPQTVTIPAGWLKETERLWQETAKHLQEHGACLAHEGRELYGGNEELRKERDRAKRTKNPEKLAEIAAMLAKNDARLARMKSKPDEMDFVVRNVKLGNAHSVKTSRIRDINNPFNSCWDEFHTHPPQPDVRPYDSVEFSPPDIFGFVDSWARISLLRHQSGYSLMMKTEKTPRLSDRILASLFPYYFFVQIENGKKPLPNDVRAGLGSLEIAHYQGGHDGRLRKQPRQETFTDEKGRLLERTPLYDHPSVALLLKGILYARGEFDGPWAFQTDDELWTALRNHYGHAERVITSGLLERVLGGTRAWRFAPPSETRVDSNADSSTFGPGLIFTALKKSPLKHGHEAAGQTSSIVLITRYLFHGHELYIGRRGPFHQFPSLSVRLLEDSGAFLVCKIRLEGQQLRLYRELYNNRTDRLPRYIEEGATQRFCRLETGPYKIRHADGSVLEGTYNKEAKQLQLRTGNGTFAVYNGIDGLTTGRSLSAAGQPSR